MADASLIATRLDRTLKAAGLAITGVSIGDPNVKATWTVMPASLQSAAQATINAFDPNDVTVAAADLDAQAQAAASAQIVKALLAELLEVKLGRTLTVADIPALQAMFARATFYYKFIVANGL